jgi:hypothetical protein
MTDIRRILIGLWILVAPFFITVVVLIAVKLSVHSGSGPDDGAFFQAFMIAIPVGLLSALFFWGSAIFLLVARLFLGREDEDEVRGNLGEQDAGDRRPSL